MKYAFMTFSCPELTLDEALSAAKEYGYDGIEARVGSNHKHGIELDATAAGRRKAKEKAQATGIALCCVATSCRFADPASAEAAVGDAHKAIDLAADVGAPSVRVFGGKFPDAMPRDDAVAQVAKCLDALKDHAGERGVVLCVESHDAWCDPGDLARVIRAVDHPAVAVNWDIMHPVRVAGASMDSAFEALKPWIRHVHCHDGVWSEDGKPKLVPIGQGRIDHRRALELLKGIDYDGFVSGEWIGWRPYPEHLPSELATLKAYEAETG